MEYWSNGIRIIRNQYSTTPLLQHSKLLHLRTDYLIHNF
jgi:hypothetical protein